MSTDIVIIDDNAQHAENTSQLLMHHGYQSSCVLNPENALDEIKNSRPKLILLDIMMPGIDGFTLLKNLKEEQETASIPVIILSGKVFPPDKKKAQALGAEKFLTKPIRSQLLLNEVKPYLD